MTTLDDDVVHHILSFIDQETLESIHEGHPVFHGQWMQRVYETLNLNCREEAKSKLADLMLKEAGKAGYVKKVEVHPWRVQPHTKSPRSWTEKLWIRFSKLIDPEYTKKQAAQRLKKRLIKDSKRIMEGFAGMKNVQEYTIHWGEGRYHRELFKACFSPLSSGEGWHSQLVKLSITIPHQFLDSLASIRLTRLETLEYHFATGDLLISEITNVHAGFLVFLGNLKDTLRYLYFVSTRTSRNLDISHLFDDLAATNRGRFERLESLSVSIPLDGAHLSVPETFVRFLQKHCHTMRQICLLTSPPGMRVGPAPVGSANFIESILSAILSATRDPLTHLRGLKVALPRHASLDVFRHFLDFHSSTLDNLTLVDRTLSCQDVRGMLSDPLRGTLGLLLTELEMRANVLTAELLFLIAVHLPQLRVLKVDYSAAGSEAINALPHFCASITNFGTLRFAGWGLQQFVIKPACLQLATTMGPFLLACIPHLQVTEE